MAMTTLTTKLCILPDSAQAFTQWQAELHHLIACQPGFVSVEISQPRASEWLIVQRFSSGETLGLWQQSAARQNLFKEVQGCLQRPIQEMELDPTALKGGVTEVFVTEAKGETEEHFHKWLAKIHLAEAKFEGFRGLYVQSPASTNGKFWITFLQFDTPENLDRWIASKERQEILEEAQPLIKSLETHRMISPYAGWFSSLATAGPLPPVWKQTLVVLLLLFPLVMLELKYLTPLTKSLDISLATFIGNTISVTLISWPLMPFALLFLGWWLTPELNQGKKNLFGTLLISLLYILEVAIFWNFF